MVHELEILANGQASMFYNLEESVPWHSLGTPAQGAQAASDAIKLSNLDWTVEKEQAMRGDQVVDGKFWIVRKTDEKVLGVVGKDYKPIQNSEAFEFFDTLVDSGEAKYETAGSLAGGKRVWLMAHIGDDIQVAGQESHRLYLALLSSHDGSKSLSAITTMVRIVCANTETMAIRGAKTSWTMTHRTTLAGKVAEARDALKLSFTYRDQFAKEVEKLMQIEVTNDKFREIMQDVLPKQKRQLDKNLTALTGIFENSPTIVDAGIGGTAWGAYNAVTEFLSHGQESRSAEAKMTKAFWGSDAKLRNKTHERLLSMTS